MLCYANKHDLLIIMIMITQKHLFVIIHSSLNFNSFPLPQMSHSISYQDPSLNSCQDQDLIVCFRNCRLFRNGHFATDAEEIWIRGGKVLDSQAVFYGERKRPDKVVDCAGLILAPGLLDIQVNGAFGVDFTSLMNLDSEQKILDQLEQIVQKMPSFGITGFCPTIITVHPNAYKKFLNILRKYKSRKNIGTLILGAHFEGPFISAKRRGCHPESLIVSSLIGNELESVYGSDLSELTYVTIAPELPGAIGAVQNLHQKGIKVSIGHTDAGNAEAQNAVDIGATCITHLYNAMRPFDHRDTGTVGLLAKIPDTIYYGMISDGVHVGELALLSAFCLNPRGLILVTDCMAALGLGDGVHPLGDLVVRVQGPEAKVDGTDTLAGSVSSMPHCIRHFSTVLNKYASNTDGVAEALKAATLNPAKFLGITDQIGTLGVGTNADFVLLDDQMNIAATFIDGLKCYQSTFKSN